MNFFARLVLLSIGLCLSLLGGKTDKIHSLSTHDISLETRYPDTSVNEVFKDNILLTLAYMDNRVKKNRLVNWKSVEQLFHVSFKLDPQEVFAFHDDVLPKYKVKLVKTTGAHFSAYEGFKSDGYLFGDGVCHLASLMNWVAKDAGLEVQSPTNHSFAIINEIPSQFGTSIYSQPGQHESNEHQNLYLKNTLPHPIVFNFYYYDQKLHMSIDETL